MTGYGCKFYCFVVIKYELLSVRYSRGQGAWTSHNSIEMPFLLNDYFLGVFSTVVHRPPDIAPQNTENESRTDKGAFTQGNLSTYFFINTLSISLT